MVMAKAARWIDASSVPEHRTKQKTSPEVDKDLQTRIRSLLVPQNEHPPPRVPNPSPEYASSFRDSDDYISCFSPRAASLSPSAVKAIAAKLVDTDPRMLSIVANNFDGPAGPIVYPDMGFLQKSPIQPGFQKAGDSNQETLSPEARSGLDDFVVGRYQKRNHRKSGSSAATSSFTPSFRSMSQSSKRSTGSRIPAFNIRTIPPASLHVDVEPSRPGMQTMPGSYISEVETTAGPSPLPKSITADSVSTRGLPISKSTRTDLSPNPEIHSRAIEALRKAMDHDKPVNPSRSVPPLRKAFSQTSLKSSTSTLKSCHLMKLAAGHGGASQAAEPVLTPSVSHGHPYREIVETPQPSLSSHSGIKSTRLSSAQVGSIDTTLEQDLNDKNHNAFEVVSLPSEPLFSAYNDNDSLYGYKSASDCTMKPDPDTLENERQALRISTLPLSNEYEKAPEAKPRVEHPNSRDTGGSSAIIRKLSQFGRSVKGISDKTVLSTQESPQLQPAVNRKEEDDMSNQPHFQELSTSSSKSRSKKSEDASDKPRLISVLRSNSNERVVPKKHWIQQLLTRDSFNSLTNPESNLTTKQNHESSNNTKSVQQKPDENPFSRKGSKVNNDVSTENWLVDKNSLIDEQQTNNEPFKRVIEDLEGLLNEALTLARQATDPIVHEISPSTSSYSINHASEIVHNSYNSSIDSDDMSSSSGDQDVEQHNTTFPTPSDYHANRYQHQEKTFEPWDESSNEQVPTQILKQHSNIQEPAVNAHYVPSRSYELEHEEDTDTTKKHFETRDWAFTEQASRNQMPQMLTSGDLTLPRKPSLLQVPLKEQQAFVVRVDKPYTKAQGPRIQPRSSSAGLRAIQSQNGEVRFPKMHFVAEEFDSTNAANLQPTGLQYRTGTQHTLASRSKRGYSYPPNIKQSPEVALSSHREPLSQLNEFSPQDQDLLMRNISLTGRRHHSFRGTHGFSLGHSRRRALIARDWRTSRKRQVAAVACFNTALMGLIIGIYAGEVPAIQYAVADEHHYTILGNVVFFIGLAITTAFFWPLPLLHGRKPYTIAALAVLLPLQFPQALAVGTSRSPDVATYRVGLLLSRAIAGLIMGFANINFKTTLLDLFGASLQSAHPHQELVSNNDVRRHGGGMGVWLGIWTWCSIGSIGVGFLIGAVIIGDLDVAWGFWLTIIMIAFALILNVLVPEVRRSPYRRSMAEVQKDGEVSRRIARGEIKMHIDATGPKWWWEEVVAGSRLCLRMLKQPGFMILSLYMGWIYGQIVMVIVLLGALTSKYYLFHPQYVGLCVAAVPLGALLAIPFQKASLFSRSRKQSPRTDSMTVRDQITWTSHLVRRAFFMISLPFAGLAYTLASGGTHTHFMVPTFFAGLIGFLSNLAIAECNGIIMETYDTSDLQPGMTGRPRRALPEEIRKKRTNYSCFPRVSAAFAIAQTFSYLIAAAATGSGGAIERRLGAQTATAVVAAVLLVLTFLLMGVLWRFKVVQMIPSKRFGTNVLTGPEDEWKPIIIGNPSGTSRRTSLLELGKQSRWSEIRRRNKLAPKGA